MIREALALALATVGLAAACFAAAPPGLAPAHQVRLFRDSVGMAHLYADREQDAFYGLGYATGEDRLLQVLTWYVAVRGELAATFGAKTPPLPAVPSSEHRGAGPLEDAVASDLNARRFQLLEIARRNLHLLPPQYLHDLEAYVAGLEAYMRSHADKTPAWAPRLEPALPLALLHFLVLEPAQVCDARRAQDKQSAPTASAGTATMGSGGLLAGSNAWAIAGARTADGRVLFESDSHGPIAAYGTLFYPFRIKAGDLDVTVIAPAGSVTFLFGYSPHFAWGITEGPRFPADCYRVAVEPGPPTQFQYDGRLQTWLGMHTYGESLKIINPPQGYIANTNVSPDMMYPAPYLKAADYPSYFAFEPGQTNSRQRRLIELLDGRANITVEDAQAIATDEVIPNARPWGAAIAAAARDQPGIVASDPADLPAFFEDLENFNGAFSKDSRGALDYYTMRTILRDQHHDAADSLSAAVESGNKLAANSSTCSSRSAPRRVGSCTRSTDPQCLLGVMSTGSSAAQWTCPSAVASR